MHKNTKQYYNHKIKQVKLRPLTNKLKAQDLQVCLYIYIYIYIHTHIHINV